MSQLEEMAAGTLIRARPWDVIGAGLAVPMVLWGFLGWFGTVGDAAGGQPGFFSGTGASGIGLVLAAAAIALNQLLEGRPHQRTSPPIAALLAGAASVVVLGGMIAKPDSATIQAGSVAGLLTALSQVGALLLGWLRGSEKSLKAANVRAVQAQQAAADLAAAQLSSSPYQGYPPPYRAAGYGGYPQAPPPHYPAAQYPPSPYPTASYPSAQYPLSSYPPPGQQYPSQPAGQYPYPYNQIPTAQYPPAHYPGQPPPGPPGQRPPGQPSGR
ncbi:MAG TPA: hypothetical protein VJ851_18625 [Jatrophihabitans sp.]|nr:hypothetical protein [Jatrophihabitans sp.]